MATICWKCGKTLTNKDGKRIGNAHFDSSVKDKPKNNNETIFATCDECYKNNGTRK